MAEMQRQSYRRTVHEIAQMIAPGWVYRSTRWRVKGGI
jgi:hypothetical protein